MTVSVAAPRLQILVNGTPIPALSAEVNTNNYYHADSFRAEIVVVDSAVKQSGFGAAFWCADGTGGSAAPVMITVQVDPGTALGGANWTTLITGRVDNVEYDPFNGTVSIDGRDRTADFIEARTFETFKNQTSSQIAKVLAARHGLTAQVTNTTTLADRYYTQDHDKITLNDFTRVTNEWDLLTFLAQQENFDVFVFGNTLYFQPSTAPGQNPIAFNFDAASQPYLISNGVSPKLKRALTLARDITVTVQSWSSKQQSAFKVTAKATGTRAQSGAASTKAGATTTQNYVLTRPNLTHDQAQTLANQTLGQLSAHERVVSIEMPGDVTMQPRQGLRISGTGTNFDMDYYISDITRMISAEGFTQTVSAKNSSPKNQTTVG